MVSIPRAISFVCFMLAPLAAQEIKVPPALAAHASEKVDVTLDSNMLQLAGKFFSDKADEAEVKKLISGLKSIFVRSFEYEKEGGYNPADIESVRAQLRAPGWSRIAGMEGKNETAEVFVRTEKDGKVGGLAVIATEPKQVTIVNIVGAVDPAQLSGLAGKFGIPKIELDKKKKSGRED
jgi:hypothetical protein